VPAVVEITSRLHSMPEIVKLRTQPKGAEALGLWVTSLSWMHTQRPRPATIPLRFIEENAGDRRHAGLLVGARLWDETGVDEYEPVRFDRTGRLIWKPFLPPSRPKIPTGVRLAVYARDGYACVECGCGDDLTLDHIRPYSLGGPDTEDNLQTMCRPCNSRKGARLT
jgi:hypothetical protein